MPRAVVLTWYGPPDALVWQDVPMPVPGLADALRDLASGHTQGTIVLVP
jgi:hypothetical protein